MRRILRARSGWRIFKDGRIRDAGVGNTGSAHRFAWTWWSVLGMSPVLGDMTGKVRKDCLFLIHFSRRYDVLILYWLASYQSPGKQSAKHVRLEMKWNYLIISHWPRFCLGNKSRYYLCNSKTCPHPKYSKQATLHFQMANDKCVAAFSIQTLFFSFFFSQKLNTSLIILGFGKGAGLLWCEPFVILFRVWEP